MPLSSIHAIVTDLGGVLMRTDDRVPRTKLAERFGMSYEEIDSLVFNSVTGKQAEAGQIPDVEHHKFLSQTLNLDLSEIPAFLGQFFGGDHLDLDLVSFLYAFRGEYKLGLLSNAWKNAAQTLRDHYHIHEYFDVVIFSAEVKMAKPDQAIYRLMEEKLGVRADQIVFLDDNKVNIDAARAGGWETVWYRSPEQAKKEILDVLGSQD